MVPAPRQLHSALQETFHVFLLSRKTGEEHGRKNLEKNRGDDSNRRDDHNGDAEDRERFDHKVQHWNGKKRA